MTMTTCYPLVCGFDKNCSEYCSKTLTSLILAISSFTLSQIYKKITVPKKAIAKLKRIGQYASNKKAATPTAPAALNAIYHDHLLPVLTKMPAGSDMRNSIASDGVLLLLYDTMNILKKAFELYLSNDDDGSSTGDEEERNLKANGKEGAIACKQFEQFAGDSGFLGGDEVIRRFSVLNMSRKNSVAADKAASGVKVGVTHKDVRQIFAASQHDVEVSEAERRAVTRNKNADHHQELMGEYLSFRIIPTLSILIHNICLLGSVLRVLRRHLPHGCAEVWKPPR